MAAGDDTAENLLKVQFGAACLRIGNVLPI